MSVTQILAESFVVIGEGEPNPTMSVKSAYHAILIGKLVKLFPYEKVSIKNWIKGKSFEPISELIQDFISYHDTIQTNTNSDQQKSHLDTKRVLEEIVSLLLT